MQQQKKLAIFDIDGTIFRKNLHFELINELSWINVFPRNVRDQIVHLYTNWLEHKGTYESYRLGLVNLFEKHIKGCKQEDVIRASEIVIAFHKDRTYIFAEDLIRKLKKNDYHVIAISGSPIEIVEEYNKKHLNFDKVFGSVYEIKNGIYTGGYVDEPIKNKGDVVRKYAQDNNLTLRQSYGIGDTESDASFLELVEYPIAFNPNENLKNIAQKNGWRIVVEKKDIIYEMTPGGNLNFI